MPKHYRPAVTLPSPSLSSKGLPPRAVVRRVSYPVASGVLYLGQEEGGERRQVHHQDQGGQLPADFPSGLQVPSRPPRLYFTADDKSLAKFSVASMLTSCFQICYPMHLSAQTQFIQLISAIHRAL
jgi:hypothetical protein